ncbi:DUF1450 domain-containing protein [Paenibacillus yanchengensis]|uniref:DUF1450 domain-containing protein n=1 Tax=Paenibacillus yanchengensis TaxID=2035833 RepID=A0ABW4YJ95_9BACL
MGLGIVIVEKCNRNALNLDELEALEKKYPDIAVIAMECLNECRLCQTRPYALVNGQKVHGKTAEESIRQIEQAIIAELDQY